MSAEEPVAGGQKPVDINAEAAEDAKRMLAELKGEPETKAEKDHKDSKDPEVKSPEVVKKDEQSERPRERRDREDGRTFRGGHGRGRGRGNFGYGSRRENIKSDLTTQEESNDPEAIRKQVEFYFSDSNLPMDKFLLEKVGGSKNNPVKIEILHSFKRMRHFQPFEAIVSALKESSTLEVVEDDTCVRRIVPLPESLNNGLDPNAVRTYEDAAMPRSIYAKGFGDEEPSTQFDIEAFFAPYGPTNAIRLRRSDTKVFKSSVFVEFADEKLQEAFLGLDPKPKYKNRDLQIMSKKQYCEQKVEDIKSGKIKPSKSFEPGKSGHDRGSKRKRDDPRDWRERRDADRKNGFRDDDRRGGRGFGSKGGRGERTRDEHVPKTPTDAAEKAVEAKAKREAATADAMAKARAMVEAENKKNGHSETGAMENGIQKDDTAVASTTKKRGRDDVDDEGDAEREVKKMDSKSEIPEVKGDS